MLDPLDNVVGDVGTRLLGIVTDDQPHLEWGRQVLVISKRDIKDQGVWGLEMGGRGREGEGRGCEVAGRQQEKKMVELMIEFGGSVYLYLRKASWNRAHITSGLIIMERSLWMEMEMKAVPVQGRTSKEAHRVK